MKHLWLMHFYRPQPYLLVIHKAMSCFLKQHRIGVSWPCKCNNRGAMALHCTPWPRHFLFLTSYSICDNISGLNLAINPVLPARTKHIEIDYHFVQEHVLDKTLTVEYTPFGDQLANIMTKPLSSSWFLTLRSKLIVVPQPIRLRRDIRV